MLFVVSASNRKRRLGAKRSPLGNLRAGPSTGSGATPDAAQIRHVAAEHQVLVLGGEEVAVFQDVVQALAVGAETLDVGHVRPPDQLAGPVAVAKVSDQRLSLGVGVVPDPTPGDGEHDLDLQVLAGVGPG